jgi:hypothetical protein
MCGGQRLALRRSVGVARAGRPRWLPVLGAALAVAFSLAGCGHTPQPTPTPRPLPSATVVSVAPQFKAHIASKTFQFEGVVSGTVTIARGGAGTESPISGSFLYHAGDYDWRLTTESSGPGLAAEEATTVEWVGVGKYRYSLDEAGTWTKDDRPGGSQARGLGGVFGVSRPLVDLGLENLDGRRLHKLAWADGPGVDSSVVDFEGSDVLSGVLVRVYFWADDDGTPAGLTFRISEPAGVDSGDDMVWEFDVVFTSLDGVKIGAPKIPEPTPTPVGTPNVSNPS